MVYRVSLLKMVALFRSFGCCHWELGCEGRTRDARKIVLAQNREKNTKNLLVNLYSDDVTIRDSNRSTPILADATQRRNAAMVVLALVDDDKVILTYLEILELPYPLHPLGFTHTR